MVKTSHALGRKGASTRGCLFTLVVLGVIGYYGVGVGSAYLRYWEMLDEMKSQARFAPTLEDQVIRRRLVTKAQELELPTEATHFVIRRLERPREIVITTHWKDTIDLPFYNWVITLAPEARALL